MTLAPYLYRLEKYRERERKINILKNNTKKLKQQKYKTKIQWSNKAIKQQHGRQNKNP